MIEVELPDGTILEIETQDPQAAANAAKSYLQKQTPYQKTKSALGTAVNLGAEVSAGMQRGALGLVDMFTSTPYNFVAEAIGAESRAKPLVDIVRQATGGTIAPEKGSFAGEGLATDIAASTGELATVGGLASKGLGMAANVMKPSTLQGVTRTLAGPSVATETLAGAASGAGSQALGAAGETVAGQPGRMVGELVGGIAAPMAMPKQVMVDDNITEQLLSGDPRQLAKAADLDQEFMAIAEEEGLAPDVLLGMASRNQKLNTVEGALAAMPGSELLESKINVAQKIRARTQDLVKQMGGFDNPGEMSDFYRANRAEMIDNLEQQSSALYKEAYDVVPRGEKINPQNMAAMLKNEISDLGGDLSSMPAEFREAVKKLMPGETSPSFDPLTMTTKSVQDLPTYHALDTFRKNLGDATKRKGPYKDMPSGMAKRLYGTLRKDQDAFLSENYPTEFKKIKQADLLVQERKAAEEATQQLMGKQLAKDLMPKLVSLTEGITKGKGSLEEFRRTMANIPEDMRPATLGTAFAQMAKGTAIDQRDFSANRMGRLYQDLMNNKAARNEIKSHMNEAQWSRFTNVGKLAEGLARVDQRTIKTGASRQVVEDLNQRKNLFERIIPKILGSYYTDKALGPMGLAGSGRYLATMMEESTDKAKRANQLLSDPHFRLKVFSEYDKMVKGGKIDPDIKQTQKIKTWISGLPTRDQATINRIGVMPFLLGSDD